MGHRWTHAGPILFRRATFVRIRIFVWCAPVRETRTEHLSRVVPQMETMLLICQQCCCFFAFSLIPVGALEEASSLGCGERREEEAAEEALNLEVAEGALDFEDDLHHEDL